MSNLGGPGAAPSLVAGAAAGGGALAPAPAGAGGGGGGGPRPGFGAGLGAFFGGIGFVMGTPAVWPLSLVPIAIATLLTTALIWVGAETLPAWIASWIGPPSGTLGSVLTFVAQAAAMIAAVIVALLVGVGLAQPLSGPALERIVRRAEQAEGAPAWPATSFVTDISRSLQSVIVGYAFGLPILALLFVVDLVFAPAMVITIPLKLLVTAMLLAWDICDYPLSIRGIRVGTRVSFMKRNAKAMLGFGLALALLGLIPCLLVLVLPAGVAGAARLTRRIERWEQANPGG